MARKARMRPSWKKAKGRKQKTSDTREKRVAQRS